MGVLNCPPAQVALLSANMTGGGQPRAQASLAARGHQADFLFPRLPGPFLGQVPATAGIVDLRTEQGWRQLWIFLIKNPCSVVLLLWHVLVTPRLLTWPYAGRSRMWMIQRLMALVLMCRAFRRSNGTVGVSAGGCEETAPMCRIPRERITTIYNPVVISKAQALARGPLDRPWFQLGTPPVVLGAGRLKEQKDFQTLIRPFARVRRQRLARLVILGEGGLRGELATLATELEVATDVALPGFVRNPFAYNVPRERVCAVVDMGKV